MSAEANLIKLAVDRANAEYFQAAYNRPGVDFEIPASIRKQTEGECVECKMVTENVDDGDFICETCLADAIAAQAEDYRLDSPTHGQGDRKR